MIRHTHAAERGQRDRRKQQCVNNRRYDPVSAVLSPEQRPVPFDVQDVVDDQDDRHADPEPFVKGFACHLIGHQAKEEDCHADVHNLFDLDLVVPLPHAGTSSCSELLRFPPTDLLSGSKWLHLWSAS